MMGAINQKNGVTNNHSHWYHIPDSPLVKVLEATLTAWSLCVPDPKLCIMSIHLPNRRGIKKSEVDFTIRAVHIPRMVIPMK
jgi:hypothetical protein